MSVPAWKVGGDPYLGTIAAIEVLYNLPVDLLARVAFQECSWRIGVIDGTIKSPAGAVGMFQLMPKYFPNAGVSWQADADTAGKYLADLYKEFHDWQLAVAAYNWGPTSVTRYEQGVANMPLETSNYVSAVFNDVPVAGSLVDV